tara:strand:- start:3068 stop:3769 length:702 start_codon:yes stop_codon:yes gene_type:complete
MSEVTKNIQLSKRYYGAQLALKELDEEFIEFLPDKDYYEKFFTMYHNNFYNISEETHRHFLTTSVLVAFPDGYTNYIIEERNELQRIKKDVQRRIDSVEREHFFFKNNNFLMDMSNLDASGAIVEGSPIYHMQSGKKRLITGDNPEQTYRHLKNKKFQFLQEALADEDIILLIDGNTLNGIPSGPDINNIKETNMSSLEINIFPKTLEEYNEDSPMEVAEAIPNRGEPNREDI